jgi:hypothetical protein
VSASWSVGNASASKEARQRRSSPLLIGRDALSWQPPFDERPLLLLLLLLLLQHTPPSVCRSSASAAMARPASTRPSRSGGAGGGDTP